MKDELKTQLELTKKHSLVFGIGKDNRVKGRIPLTPHLELALRDDEERIYLSQGFSLGIHWLGFYAGFAYVKYR